MMARTVEIEAHLNGTPTYLDLVKGSDFRRTAITCLVYASQNFVGNLIANQSVYFFERELSRKKSKKEKKSSSTQRLE